MSDGYPSPVNQAKVKCISCNSPAVEVDSGNYVCVDCGQAPIRRQGCVRNVVERDGVGIQRNISPSGNGVEVRLSITSNYYVPTAVRIVEPVAGVSQALQDSPAIEAVGEWRTTASGIEFTIFLDPESEIEVTYSVDSRIAYDEFESIQPRIDQIEVLGSDNPTKEISPVELANIPDSGFGLGKSESRQAEEEEETLIANGSGLRQEASGETQTALSGTSATPTVDSEVTKLPASTRPDPTETSTTYLLPPGSARTPEISVVLPTKNEEAGIGACIEAIVSALEKMERFGEVIVSDSSTDRTPEIARSYGAKVVTPDGDGYGAAYRYGFQHTRGDYIVMGDADTTYDFEELPKLFHRITAEDTDLVMGSRFAGEIKPGAMPWLHRKIGNPLLTKFLNTFYDANVSDAHSGFRVITRDALDALELKSDGMEFASEMVMAAGEQGMTIDEVPITYHPRVGEAKLDSLSDGWRHVKFMLINTPTYVFSIPAVGLTAVGILAMALSIVDSQLFGVTFGIHTVIAGSLLTIIGYQIASLGVFSAVSGTAIRSPRDPITTFIRDQFKLEHGATLGVAMYGIGAVYATVMIIRWVSSGYSSLPFVEWNMVAFTLIVLGIQTVFYSFFLSLLGQRSE